MKKCIAIVGLLLVSCISMYAQLRLTPEVGVSMLKTDSYRSNTLVAPRIGIGVDYYFNHQESGWGIGTGLYFYQKKESSSLAYMSYRNDKNQYVFQMFEESSSFGNEGDLEGMKLHEVTFDEYDTRRDYLQLPVLLSYRWKIADHYGISVAAGPYVAIGVGGKHEIRQSSFFVEDEKSAFIEKSYSPYKLLKYNRFDMGFSSRLSMSAHRLVMNVRYETNLNRRNAMGCDNLFSIGLGYSF